MMADIPSQLLRGQDTSTALKAEKAVNPKDTIGIRKVSMSTVPAGVLAELAVAMTEGALKYGRHNYRVGQVRASVYYDAAMRHLMAWWEGENIDEGSALSHVTKAIASLVVLCDAIQQDRLEDDRPPSNHLIDYPRLNLRCDFLLEQSRDLSQAPVHYTRKLINDYNNSKQNSAK